MQVEYFGRLVRDFITDELLTALAYPELNRVLEHWFKRHRNRQLAAIDVLPCLTCVAVGGSGEAAVPVAAFWPCYFLASKVFDSIQDDENYDQPWMDAGTKGAISIGLALIATGNSSISYLTEGEVASEILLAFGRAWALAAKSQIDPQNDLALETYFANIIASTAEPFATAAWSGARLATDDSLVLEAFTQYGLNAGIALAITSDCHGLQDDVADGIYKLPVIYAMSLNEHPRHDEMAALLRQCSKEPGRVEHTMAIMQSMHATEWSLTIAAEYRQRAKAALYGFTDENMLPLCDYVF